MFARENRYAQNHMISITQRKPGAIRWFTWRLVFWVIGEFATRFYPPGFLSDIGTIHFARWVTAREVPTSCSCPTTAAAGKAIWRTSSPCPCGPDGGVVELDRVSAHGESLSARRNRRRALQTLRPPQHGPDALLVQRLSEPHHRRPSAPTPRSGAAFGGDDRGRSAALAFLVRLGGAADVQAHVSSEIQSLIFGGLGFMQYGICLVCRTTGRDTDGANGSRRYAARCLQRRTSPRRRRCVRWRWPGAVWPASGCRERLDTFPFAFVEGMATGAAPVSSATWAPTDLRAGAGAEQRPMRRSWFMAARPRSWRISMRASCAACSHGCEHRTRCSSSRSRCRRPSPSASRRHVAAGHPRHPQGLRSGDPIHMVEPGEFILGYPDNRGNMPPGPTLPANRGSRPTTCRFSTVTGFGRTVVETDRDIGFNGSFLVIRELEQDVHGFAEYCEAEALDRSGPAAQYVTATSSPPSWSAVGRTAPRWCGTQLSRPRGEKAYEPQQAAPRKMAGLQQAASQSNPARDQSAPETARLISRRPRPLAAARRERPRRQRLPLRHRRSGRDPLPFGSHIRRSNPRDSLDPGSAEQISITNRHRIIRVGRQYEPHPGKIPGCCSCASTATSSGSSSSCSRPGCAARPFTACRARRIRCSARRGGSLQLHHPVAGRPVCVCAHAAIRDHARRRLFLPAGPAADRISDRSALNGARRLHAPVVQWISAPGAAQCARSADPIESQPSHRRGGSLFSVPPQSGWPSRARPTPKKRKEKEDDDEEKKKKPPKPRT